MVIPSLGRTSTIAMETLDMDPMIPVSLVIAQRFPESSQRTSLQAQGPQEPTGADWRRETLGSADDGESVDYENNDDDDEGDECWAPPESFSTQQQSRASQDRAFRVLESLPQRERPVVEHESVIAYPRPSPIVDSKFGQEDSIQFQEVDSSVSSPPGLMYDSDGDSESSEGPRSPSPRPSLPHTRSKTDKSSSEIEQEHVSFSKVVLTKFSNPPRYKPKKVKFHQCSVCLKSFPRPSGLRTHMNSHTNTKPHACPYPGCDKTFSVVSNAKRHYRTHSFEFLPESEPDSMFAPKPASPADSQTSHETGLSRPGLRSPGSGSSIGGGVAVRWESLEFEFPIESEAAVGVDFYRDEVRERSGKDEEADGVEGARRRMSLPPISTLVAEIEGSAGPLSASALANTPPASNLAHVKSIRFDTDTVLRRNGSVKGSSSQALRWIPVGLGSRAYRRSGAGRQASR